MDFKTNEGVVELFKSINCIGNENCFFITFKDTNREGIKYGLMGGAAGTLGGAIAGAASSFSSGFLDGIENYSGFIINATDKGLGMIPLNTKGISLTLKLDKMEPLIDKYFFIPYEEVEKIIVKKFSIFNKSTQKVKIKLKMGKTLHLIARVVEKNVPYHNASFPNFMNKYNNK